MRRLGDLYFDWNPVPRRQDVPASGEPNADFANNRTIDVTVEGTRYGLP